MRKLVLFIALVLILTAVSGAYAQSVSDITATTAKLHLTCPENATELSVKVLLDDETVISKELTLPLTTDSIELTRLLGNQNYIVSAECLLNDESVSAFSDIPFTTARYLSVSHDWTSKNSMKLTITRDLSSTDQNANTVYVELCEDDELKDTISWNNNGGPLSLEQVSTSFTWNNLKMNTTYRIEINAGKIDGQNVDALESQKIIVVTDPEPDPFEGVTETETTEPTETDTLEPTETETQQPTETDTPEPTETETQQPTETETPEPTETDTPESTETETPEPTETETPEPTERPFYPFCGRDCDWLKPIRLPRTGFPTGQVTLLSGKPASLHYRATNLFLQIPSLDVAADILTVPNMNGEFNVDYLGNAVGLLEGSGIPGKNTAVITGHNHLNLDQAGPFAMLSLMDVNDRIIISEGDDMHILKVVANLKVEDSLEPIANRIHDNTLILVTCEDEALDGSYLHRRVILAAE